MIRYLELRNWRAFNKVALHLTEGTTFVVAENGIGKTSLLRGAAWTLFAPRHVDPKVELRHGVGAGETAGLVVMSTTEGDLEVERTYRVGVRPANTLRATLAGVAVDPEQLDDTLTRLVGARPDIACDLGFVHQHALATDQALFANVGQLLRRLTGVEQLQSARSVIVNAQRRHDKTARELAKSASNQKSARDELVNEIAISEDALETIERGERSAHERLQLASQLSAAHQQWARYDLEVGAHQEEVSALDFEITTKLAAETLEDAIDRVSGEQSAVTDQHAQQLASQHLHERLAGQLEGAAAVCPVCRQSIDKSQATLAAEFHQQAIDDASTHAVAVEGALGNLRETLEALRRLNRKRSELVVPLAPSSGRPPTPVDYQEATEAAEASHRDAQQQVADARAALYLLERQLADADHTIENDRRAERTRRLEAVSVAAVDVLDRSIGRHVSERIDPLSETIRDSWGQFFTTDGGIVLNDQGQIELVATDGTRLAYGQLSGGQQMLATLTMRLTLISATTRLNCIWLDEPLEHLDPTNRRRAASLLVRASGRQGIRQVLATTYEEETARRLAATDSSVELRYVRSD